MWWQQGKNTVCGSQVQSEVQLSRRVRSGRTGWRVLVCNRCVQTHRWTQAVCAATRLLLLQSCRRGAEMGGNRTRSLSVLPLASSKSDSSKIDLLAADVCVLPSLLVLVDWRLIGGFCALLSVSACHDLCGGCCFAHWCREVMFMPLVVKAGPLLGLQWGQFEQRSGF